MRVAYVPGNICRITGVGPFGGQSERRRGKNKRRSEVDQRDMKLELRREIGCGGKGGQRGATVFRRDGPSAGEASETRRERAHQTVRRLDEEAEAHAVQICRTSWTRLRTCSSPVHPRISVSGSDSLCCY